MPTPAAFGREHATDAARLVDVVTDTLTARPEVATVHLPAASVNTYVNTRALRSTWSVGVLRMIVTLAAGAADTEKALEVVPTCAPPAVSPSATKSDSVEEEPVGALKKADRGAESAVVPTSAAGRGFVRGASAPNEKPKNEVWRSEKGESTKDALLLVVMGCAAGVNDADGVPLALGVGDPLPVVDGVPLPVSLAPAPNVGEEDGVTVLVCPLAGNIMVAVGVSEPVPEEVSKETLVVGLGVSATADDDSNTDGVGVTDIVGV